MKTGIKDNGWFKNGYKLFKASPMIIKKEILIPTDKTIFLTGFIPLKLNMRRTKKPGTIEKNMKDSASLKKGIFKIIDRSVNVRKIITVNIQFLMLKSFIMLFIFKFEPSKTSKTSY